MAQFCRPMEGCRRVSAMTIYKWTSMANGRSGWPGYLLRRLAQHGRICQGRLAMQLTLLSVILSLGQVEPAQAAPPPPLNAAPRLADGTDESLPRAGSGYLIVVADEPAEKKGTENGDNGENQETPRTVHSGGFLRRLLSAYLDEFHPKEENGNGEEPKRRALPAPFDAPPFPTAEYQGFPLIGVPVDTTKYPLMKALDGTAAGDFLDNHRLRVYGWINFAGNASTNRDSNTITSYWVVPNSVQL